MPSDPSEGGLVARGTELGEEVDARLDRHVPVGKHGIGRMSGHLCQAFGPVRRFDDLGVPEPGFAQGLLHDLAHYFAVVDDEELHWRRPFPSSAQLVRTTVPRWTDASKVGKRGRTLVRATEPARLEP
jgi:hypothetical protein